MRKAFRLATIISLALGLILGLAVFMTPSAAVNAGTVTLGCDNGSVLVTWVGTTGGVAIEWIGGGKNIPTASGTFVLPLGSGPYPTIVVVEIGVGMQQVHDFFCAPPPPPDADGDGVTDAEDRCPFERGSQRGGDVNGCPTSGEFTENFYQTWEGNPNNPTYDGRIGAHPNDTFAVYCVDGQFLVWGTSSNLLAQVSLSFIAGMESPSSVAISDSVTLGRSNDSLVIVGPDNFVKEINLPDCLGRGAVPG